MRRLLLLTLFLGALILGAARWRAQGQTPWAKIATGLEMRRLRTGGVASQGQVTVVALRTSPTRVRVATGANLDAAGWRRRTGALVAVNGGFFDEAGHSLGLRVSNSHRASRLHGTRWGIFYVRRGRAQIVRTRDFTLRPSVREAVQCGPLLVANGRPQTLKPQWARRTGIGVQRDGRVVIAVADGALSFQDWAELWAARGGLNCPNALNLDGGSSTQLSLKTGERSLEITGITTVPDAVIIK
ncbi:MAG: phosphodiester glycosidase family protein [Armatimonadota bacterium]|nr:phosphodiester glycosidase family protein [Armatimonadota bacterium]